MKGHRATSALAALCLALCAVREARAVKITEFTVPTTSSSPYWIALGGDGRLWFTEYDGNQIGAMTTDGTFMEYSIPDVGVACNPVGIASIPLGGLYFVGGTSHREYTISFAGSASVLQNDDAFAPAFPVAGPDGRVWVTYSSGPVNGISADHLLSNSPSGISYTGFASSANGVAVGADGNIWFTEPGASKIGHIGTDGSGLDQQDTVTPSAKPLFIAAAPDGDLWFTEQSANKIGRRARGTGTITEYDVPTASSMPAGIALGPDGAMWFTETTTNKIGRITTGASPAISEFPASGSPTGIVSGGDGNLYFTEFAGNKIGKIQVFVAGDVNGSGNVDVSDVFYLINFLFAGGPAPK